MGDAKLWSSSRTTTTHWPRRSWQQRRDRTQSWSRTCRSCTSTPFDDSQLRALLANRCVNGSTAGDLVDNFANSTGLELWRNLSGYFNPLVEFRKVEQTMSVMNPGRAKDLTRLGEMIPAWENLYEENKRRIGDMIPDTWKIGTLYRMMPQSLEHELIKDHFIWDTYEKLKAHVYLMIHSRTAGHSPMLHNL